MSYRDQLQDTDAYDGWGDDDTNCDECGQVYEHCQCLVHEPPSESEPPTSEELWAAYRESGDTKDLPF
jgi:hypothetical protein